jgi:hypothetical protein
VIIAIQNRDGADCIPADIEFGDFLGILPGESLPIVPPRRGVAAGILHRILRLQDADSTGADGGRETDRESIRHMVKWLLRTGERGDGGFAV